MRLKSNLAQKKYYSFGIQNRYQWYKFYYYFLKYITSFSFVRSNIFFKCFYFFSFILSASFNGCIHPARLGLILKLSKNCFWIDDFLCENWHCHKYIWSPLSTHLAITKMTIEKINFASRMMTNATHIHIYHTYTRTWLSASDAENKWNKLALCEISSLSKHETCPKLDTKLSWKFWEQMRAVGI